MIITHKPVSRRLLALSLASRSVAFSTVNVPVTPSTWMARTVYAIPAFPACRASKSNDRSYYVFEKQISRASRIGPSSAWAVHTFAIRKKCRCKAGLRTSPTNCMQSDAKRRHSKSCFRDFSECCKAPRLDIRHKHCTASLVLSVVYATDKRRKHRAICSSSGP